MVYAIDSMVNGQRTFYGLPHSDQRHFLFWVHATNMMYILQLQILVKW